LIKLADIVQVIDIGLLACAALARRRDPDIVDARGFEARKSLEQALPVALVGRDVPFESLEETLVFGRGPLA
jgi:hypothetical protein